MKSKSKKNILFVTQNFYPESFGINDIVTDMAERGFNVDVLTGLPNYPLGRYYKGYGLFKRGDKHFNGARLYRCAVFPRLINSNVGISLNYASFAFFASLKLIRLAFKKYDKVFVYEPSPLFQSIPALIIAKLKRCEKIIYVLDIWPDSVYSVVDIKNKIFKRWLEKYSSKTYCKFDTVLVTSKGFIPRLKKLGVNEQKMVYLPQWSAPSKPCNGLDNKYKRFADTFNVAFTGNVGVPQNLGILIESAQILKDYNKILFVIVGDGDFLSEFKLEAQEKGVGHMFVFEGGRPFSEMACYLAVAHCLVASLKDIELFTAIIPAKIQAYMLSGKPILCAINGESANIINQAGCGFTSPAGDASALAENIIKLYLMTHEKRHEMGQNGVRYANENFCRERLLDELSLILSR